ncbi:MAG: hypothetical protein PHY40_02290 [Patescibacteria group bacterium]|nr:hypothetical protein [Patescibacteria group bacterium]
MADKEEKMRENKILMYLMMIVFVLVFANEIDCDFYWCDGEQCDQFGCRCLHDGCYWSNYSSITDYDVNPDILSPSGILVDTSGFEVDLEELDKQIADLETCLRIPVRRNCLTVKIADDWYQSVCSGQQLFPCNIDSQICYDKDVEPTAECPCACRSMVQNENTIITTPNLYLFRAELARMITGENNIWVIPEITKCMNY